MEQTNQLISTAEAAKFLGIKVSYLHKLMMRRVIPYYKPNGKLCFFDKAELEAWMKNVRVASQAELDQQAQKYIGVTQAHPAVYVRLPAHVGS